MIFMSEHKKKNAGETRRFSFTTDLCKDQWSAFSITGTGAGMW